MAEFESVVKIEVALFLVGLAPISVGNMGITLKWNHHRLKKNSSDQKELSLIKKDQFRAIGTRSDQKEPAQITQNHHR